MIGIPHSGLFAPTQVYVCFIGGGVNIWILHGQLIILIVNSADGKYLNTLIILFINFTFGYFIGN